MKTTLLASLFLLCLPAASLLAGSHAPAGAKTIAEVAASDGRFSTLLAAVKAADLVPALAGPGPLTVFAPTDAAFKALPEGVVAGLLKPEARGDLMRVLTYHVVQGKVLSTDLLKATSAPTLAGPSVSFGLRVGSANVIQADVLCSNGVIHVIDAVLLPPAEAPKATMAPAAHTGGAADMIRAAIEVGAPAYNAGDIEGCARTYADTARTLLASEGLLGEMHAMELANVLATRHEGADAQAWALRRSFDRVLADDSFRPRMEAELPAGFPGPGPVGRVVMKQYPGYRAARAQGGQSSFWTLFQHIQSNDVKMTTPVEMTMDEQMRSMDMAFLYERPEQGAAGMQGRVAVLDLPPLKVLSIGIRGDTSRANIELARKALEQRLAKEGLVAAGPYRQLGYNSPMVPSAQRFWELQVPVQASR
ncbi:MAG: heme-binding protein [Planctomycetia bacterium]